MSARFDLRRLAMGTFDFAGQVWTVADALSGEGVPVDGLCLLAEPETMAGLGRALNAADNGPLHLSALYERVQEWPGARGRILASSCPLVWEVRHAIGHSGHQHLDRGSTGGGLEDFIVLINGTKAGIIVSSRNPGEHRSCTRVLLRLCSHGVRTLEYAVPE